MSKPRVVLLRAAGINCDEETEFAWTLAGAEARRVHVNRLIEHPRCLREAQILTLPGGFSYGDDIASGRILANQLVHHLLAEVRTFAEGGGLILGICNGFQVLVKAGLLPGPGLPGATVTFNDSGRFEARWTTLEAGDSACVFLSPGERLSLPVAHGEGKVVLESDGGASGDESAFLMLKAANCVALRYVRPDGGEADYPWNPNGSVHGIAGLCDRSGRVFGLMPHPERCVVRTQTPAWTRDASVETDGLRIFRRAVEYFR